MNIITFLKATLKVAIASAERADDYVKHNEPKEVETGCWRTTHRADGKPKMEFYTAQEANFQAVKQFVRHGEICTPYRYKGKYYTGHRSKWKRTLTVLENVLLIASKLNKGNNGKDK